MNSQQEIIAEVLEYIEFGKAEDKNMSLMDIIMEYTIRKDIDILEVGDAISTDEYLKRFIESDCILHKIIQVPKETEDVNSW